MDEKKPSEVFLALWYSRICGQVIAREEFFALAETWTEIRRMEGTTPQTPPAPAPLTQGSQEAESTPEGVEKVHPDRVEKVHEDEPEPGVQNEPSSGPDPAKSAAAAAGMATRKKNALEKLEWLRMAQNRTMADIVDADPKLTLNVLLDFINCKPIPLPKLAAIERAVKKLEAEG